VGGFFSPFLKRSGISWGIERAAWPISKLFIFKLLARTKTTTKKCPAKARRPEDVRDDDEFDEG